MSHRPHRRRTKPSQRADPAAYRDIQDTIGRELRARYEASRDLPHDLLALVNRLRATRRRDSGDRS